jgi:hypothetical protein
MPKYRKVLISAVLLALVAVGTFIIYRYAAGAPERIIRLLPEGNQLAYVNLKPVRLFWDLSKSKPPELEGYYRQFVDETGIQFERDLDEVAASWQQTDGHRVESATVFAGRFDAAKLERYLQKIAARTEAYRGLTIYSIPNQDHMVRACVLDDSRVAATTSSSPEVIHGIIERLHGSPDGPELLRGYYRYVPAASLAWGITRIGQGSAATAQPFGANLSFLENTTAIASLRYNGSLLVRADVFAAGEAEARQVMDSANAFLAIYGLLDRSSGMRNDADLKAALNSIRLEQKGNVVTATATCSGRLLQKFQSEIKSEVVNPSAPAAETPPPASRKR